MLAGNYTFLTENITEDRKKFITQSKYIKLLILIVSSNIFHWESVKESKVGVVFGAKFGPS